MQSTFFLARGKAPKSTICGTKESTKKHDLWHEGEHQKARSRARFWHEGEHTKKHYFARGRTTKTTILCTKESTKKHDLESRARCLDKGEQCTKDSTKKHDFGTKESTKKHDIEHGFWHEGEHQKARFCARGGAPKSTILCTRESTKQHDIEHDFFARGKAPNAHSEQRSPKI